MEDLAVPERRDGRHAAVQARAGVPAMPVIRPSEQYTAIPYPLVDGVSPTIGWLWKSKAKGGPVFVIIRRGALGTLKVVERFPLTDDGWASAWKSLVTQTSAAAAQFLAKLRAREADAARRSSGSRDVNELDARSLSSLREVA